MVEKALGVEGDEILYVGDHIYTDAGQRRAAVAARHAVSLRTRQGSRVCCLFLFFQNPSRFYPELPYTHICLYLV